MNVAEAHEVIEQVISLVEDWPIEWGKGTPEQAAAQIAVIATYPDQVSSQTQALRIFSCYFTS